MTLEYNEDCLARESRDDCYTGEKKIIITKLLRR